MATDNRKIIVIRKIAILRSMKVSKLLKMILSLASRQESTAEEIAKDHYFIYNQLFWF